MFCIVKKSKTRFFAIDHLTWFLNYFFAKFLEILMTGSLEIGKFLQKQSQFFEQLHCHVTVVGPRKLQQRLSSKIVFTSESIISQRTVFILIRELIVAEKASLAPGREFIVSEKASLTPQREIIVPEKASLVPLNGIHHFPK